MVKIIWKLKVFKAIISAPAPVHAMRAPAKKRPAKADKTEGRYTVFARI